MQTRQFPIDTYDAAWVELTAIDSGGSLSGYVAYALFVGDRVTTATSAPHETSKGSIDVFQPATEYWFNATVDAIKIKPEHSLQMAIVRADTRDQGAGVGWSKIVAAVAASNGLVESSGELLPILIGRVGDVAWSCNESHLSLIEGVPTYAAEVDSIVWAVSVEQSARGDLQALYISNDDAEVGYGPLPELPEVLPYAESYSPQRIFIGYQSPP